MEGFILTACTIDPKWRTVYLKLDDISAHLVAFTDRCQADFQWKLSMMNADVATPVSGDPNHNAIANIDETPHCFYVHGNNLGNDQWHFFSAADDVTKKQWMKKLLKSATEGPQPPRFAAQVTPNSPSKTSEGNPGHVIYDGPTYGFMARVAEVRKHGTGKHAEYKLICHCEIYSRVAGRRLAKEWHVWHRFSEFDALNEALKPALGDKMADIPFHKYRRDAFRSFFGRGFDESFLEERRMQLDTFLSRVCALEGVVEFFKPHSNNDLKKFVFFGENCEDVDHAATPRKTSGASSKLPRSPKKYQTVEDSSSHNRNNSVDEEASASSPAPVATCVDGTAADKTDVQLEVLSENPISTSGHKHHHHQYQHHDKSNKAANSSTNTISNDEPRASESRRSRKKAKSRANKNAKDNANGREEVEIVRAPSPVKDH